MLSARDQSRQVSLRKAPGVAQRWHRLFITGVAALVFTINIALVQHQYDFELHAAGDSCKICLEAHALSHGVAATFISPALPWTGIAPLAELKAGFRLAVSSAYSARAPPL